MERSNLKGGISKTGTWLGCLFLCLYVATSQRGVAWQDSGVFQLRTIYRDLAGNNGLACAHPLYIAFTNLSARLLSGFLDVDLPHAANLASAFWMAFALVLFFDCALRLSRSRLAASIATLSLGFSHLAWWLSTIAESYTMSLAFLLTEAWCVIRILQGENSRTLHIQAAIFSGLGFSVHNLSLLSLPVSAAALACAARSRGSGSPARPLPALRAAASGCALAAVWAASACMILIPAVKMAAAGATFRSALSNLLVGAYGANVAGVASVSPGLTAANFGIAALSLSSPFWFLGAAALPALARAHGGCRALARRLGPDRLYCAALFAVHALFALRYRIADQVLFFLPTMAFAALALSPALATRLRAWRAPARALLLLSVPACALALPILANRALRIPAVERRVLASRGRSLPFRDEIRYWALPWKHDEDSAERFAEAAIAQLNALGDVAAFADSTSAPPILLRQYLASSNWTLFSFMNDASRFIGEALAGRTVYAISPVPGYCPSAALATGNVQPLLPAAPAK